MTSTTTQLSRSSEAGCHTPIVSLKYLTTDACTCLYRQTGLLIVENRMYVQKVDDNLENDADDEQQKCKRARVLYKGREEPPSSPS